MQVAHLIKGLNPKYLSSALVEDTNDPSIFSLKNPITGEIIQEIPLTVLQQLDKINCVIWENQYLYQKSMGFLSAEELLPTSFESGPEVKFLKELNDNETNTEITTLDKVLFPTVSFIGIIVVLVLAIGLFTLGKFTTMEIISTYGIFICLISLITTAGLSFLFFWKKA